MDNDSWFILFMIIVILIVCGAASMTAHNRNEMQKDAVRLNYGTYDEDNNFVWIEKNHEETNP